MKTKILVTGAAGFLGFHVVKALAERGSHVVGVDAIDRPDPYRLKKQRAQKLRQMGIKLLQQDLREADWAEITHCIHLAARANVAQSVQEPEALLDANINAFIHVTDRCQERDVPLVYASSSAASDPTANPYAATKALNELMAEKLPRATGLRYFTIYGPWGRPDMAYFHFYDAIQRGETITLYSEGKVSRDFIYIDDAVEATLAALNRSEGHRVLDIGTGTASAIHEVVRQLERLMRQKARVVYRALPDYDVPHTQADPVPAREQLGFVAKINLQTGLERFVKWRRQLAP